MTSLQFWFDFSCPFAYVASERVEEMVRRCGAELDPRPMLLGGVFRAQQTPQVPALAFSPAKAKHNGDDIRRTAAVHGVPLTMPSNHPMSTVDALRALLVVGPPFMPLAHAFFRAYWVRGIDVSSREGIARVLSEAGHDAEKVIAELSTQRIKDELRRRTDEAVANDVFGAPTFIVDGQLFWGADRMQFVERALGGTPEQYRPTASSLAPVDFWFDYSSPFSYIASERVERLLGDALRWRPMLLGAVFKALDQVNVPLFSMNEAKQKHTQSDFVRQARSAEVEIKWPSRFPMNTVLPLRITMLLDSAPSAVHAIYRAYWVEDRDISSPEVMREICDALGHDGKSLVDRAQEPAIKTALREQTEAAVAAGVFGAPTFVVHPRDGEPSLFWGNDRLEWAVRFAAGDERLR
jgi:2-hydroxychromene-2-carboxylate isomerase